MKTMKRITALALAAATALSLLASAPVQAASYAVKTTATYYRDGEKWVKQNSSSYTYDSKGRRATVTDTYFNARWSDAKQKMVTYKSVSVASYKYDNQGRWLEYRRTQDGKEDYRQKFTYSSKKETITIYEEGKLQEKQVSTLNNGQITNVKYYNAAGKLTGTDIYSYNTTGKAKGRVAKITHKPASGKSSTTTYTYTFSGKYLRKTLISRPDSKTTTTFYNNGKQKTWKYEAKDWIAEDQYDKNGVTTYSMFKDLGTGYSSATTYENGREKKEIVSSKDENGKTVKHTYTFKHTLKSGRVTQTIKYEGTNAVEKTTYTYKKI